MEINKFIETLKKIRDKYGDIDVMVEENYWSQSNAYGNGLGNRTILSSTGYVDATMDDLSVVNDELTIQSRDVWMK